MTSSLSESSSYGSQSFGSQSSSSANDAIHGLPLTGMQALNLSINLPGPAAAARLHSMGATVIKVEPPSGDPLGLFVPDWYRILSIGQQVLALDLKTEAGQARLEELLATSDLLLTASRPSALHRMGLGWQDVHRRHPRLCQVAILGYSAPDQERSGHDLTYQAEQGLVQPPRLPSSLIADLAGAERAVSAALALLLARERGQGAGYAEVALAEAAEALAQPLLYGLTMPGGLLGGALARYNLYPASDGWVAVAALEGHFWEKLTGELGFESGEVSQEELRQAFASQSAQFWEAWARERDLPLAAVR